MGQKATLNLANETLGQLAKQQSFDERDLINPIVTDHYTSQGITHIYYQQTVDNIGIFGTSASVHIKNKEVFAANINFLHGLSKRLIKNELLVKPLETVSRIAQIKGYPLIQTQLEVLAAEDNTPTKSATISQAGISLRPILMELVYIPKEDLTLQLAWSVYIDELDGAGYKNFIVNASTGEIEKEINLTISCNFDHDHSNHLPTFETSNRLEELLNSHQTANSSNHQALTNTYTVYSWPIESPNFGGRSIVSSPWNDNTTASPNGWHQIGVNNYTSTRGNNVDAYDDSNRTNSPTNGDAARANGGASLDFNFPLDVNGDPTNYKPAAITNLFYWNNITHDIWYNYGFDEPSGNFQEENYSGNGQGSDYVYAEAQDGSGTCNANFSTPIDGGNPRMQMYLCNNNGENRDGDFDNGVIVHEYGHGISIRLTGGPSTSACLFNGEQMGEGWSDWFGLVMTIQAADNATKSRPMGTWLFEQGPTGNGIRPYPYNTDMSVNPMTYGTIDDGGISAPHGLGSVWATMLWDLTWAMIDKYGWDSDLYNGTGGNNKTMSLVIEGLKIQPCSPGFVDGRDAILAADRLLYGGDNQCLIWEVFARRGLGYSADQGSTSSRFDGTEAFDMPPSCSVLLEKTADKTSARLGEEITYTLTAVSQKTITQNNLVLKDFLPSNLEFISASDGGQINNQTVTWPTISLAPLQGIQRTVTAKVRPELMEVDSIFEDNLENGIANWAVSNESGNATWSLQSSRTYSGSNAFYTPGFSSTSITNLTTLTSDVLPNNAELNFQHYYDIETNWDGGRVLISTDGGTSWEDLGPKFTQNGYDGTAYSLDVFTGTSEGWIESKVDLSAYEGMQVQIRFQMRYDVSISREGWFIDDIKIANLDLVAVNLAEISNSVVTNLVEVNEPTNIIFEPYASCEENMVNIEGPDNDTIPPGDYHVSNEITSSGIVKNNTVVKFYAGNAIRLQPGFHAHKASTFLAKIQECEESDGGTPAIQTPLPKLAVSDVVSKNELTIHPNPFTQQAIIAYQLDKSSPVSIELFDITGQMVKSIYHNSQSESGTYQVTLDAGVLESGAYWLTMHTKAEVLTKKVFLVKP